METTSQPDPDLGAELRQGAGSEWAEEASEDEQLTEVLRKRRLDLSDVLKEISNRGDRVTIQFGGHSFGGVVSHAGEDYATVVAPGQSADVRLDASTWSIVPSLEPGDTQPGGAGTFKELLQEFEASNARVRLALPEKQVLVGQIAVVATDHLEVNDADGRLLYLPFEMVLGVIRSTDFQ